MKTLHLRLNILLALLLAAGSVGAGDHSGKRPGRTKLAITRDAETGQVKVSWSGRGMLRQGRDLNDSFRAVGRSDGPSQVYVTEAAEAQELFTLQPAGSPVVSDNIVGYVNLTLPPGLSLIANPLYYTNNSIAFWMPDAPDGAQVYKYTASGGYEVSTFDAALGGWSNPELQVTIGDGFFFNNPSPESRTYLFVGEVHLGVLINPLAAGISTEGALVPQAGSINTVHGIPGEPGDELRVYVNDGQGGGDYSVSVFDAAAGGWVPDLTLGVGQGFWLLKQNAQDWIRIFSVN